MIRYRSVTMRPAPQPYSFLWDLVLLILEIPRAEADHGLVKSLFLAIAQK